MLSDIKTRYLLFLSRPNPKGFLYNLEDNKGEYT